MTKIRSVTHNNRRRVFEVETAGGRYPMPYSKVHPRPGPSNPIARVFVDKELAREGFTYLLDSGEQGSIHVEQVLDYNQDPGFLRDALLYRLTIEAQKRIVASALSRREIIRRLGTSASQFYRLLDQSNARKSIDQLLKLLHVLDCEVDLVVREKKAPKKKKRAA
jgi:predicted XRE-type DNA-binding protein